VGSLSVRRPCLNRALFTSARTDWETPSALFRLLDVEFAFTLDVCATRLNRKCRRYFTPAINGLRQPWPGSCWMNPPYGRAIGVWVKKALEESQTGAIVVCLLPARIDTAWWHDGVMKASEIRLLRGRLRFVGAASPAPFPSAVAIFDVRRNLSAMPRVISWDWQGTLGRATGRAA
jgi:site-specific DNA-methyltransferase (adenine-specific)